jgi:hypothetical protein
MADEIVVTILDADSDAERLDEAAAVLRAELLALDVEDVVPARGGAAPAGTRAFDVAAVGALVVVATNSVELVNQLVTTVRAWLRGRPPAGQEVELTVGDKTIRLAAATSEQQERLVNDFLQAIGRD